MQYTITKKQAKPSPEDNWDSQYWADVPALAVDNFIQSPVDSGHRPDVKAKVVHTGLDVHVFFRVKDQYVRCVHTEYQSSVCRDSCVEFFVQPAPGPAYFNFEINCGGTMLLYFIEDPTPADDGFAKFRLIEESDGKMVEIHASMPTVVDPEITEPTDWTVKYSVPIALFEKYLGPLGNLEGQSWRANFYKCGDQTSRPHHASWAPLQGPLSFHKPEFFAPIIFGA